MLIAKNLFKAYKRKQIVKGVTISVKSAEIVGLLGPNGAGKSTSFHMMSGLIKPDIGKIFFNGCDITNLSLSYRARLGIVYLPQETSIFRDMTVEENLMTALEIIEKNKIKRKSQLDNLLNRFSMTHLKSSDAILLSGGERRKLEIARCLAMNPKYILFDEPLSGVDPIAVKSILCTIQSLKQEGIGILITDHNVKEALSLIDKAYIIYDGSIIAYGQSGDIIKDQQVLKIYLGENFRLDT